MPKIDPPTALSAEEVEEISAKLDHFAKRYKSLAETMRSNAIPRIPVRNLKTLRMAVGHIQKAVNKAYQGYDDALMMSGVFADPTIAKSIAAGKKLGIALESQEQDAPAEQQVKPKKGRGKVKK